VLPRPFYLNDVLIALDLVQSLLSVRRFTTDNSYSMEFDLFSLSVKDLATRPMLARYNNTGPLYTLPLPASPTPPQRVAPYAIVAAATSATWHRHLVTPGPISSPSCRAAQPSPALEAEMIPCVMSVSLVGMLKSTVLMFATLSNLYLLILFCFELLINSVLAVMFCFDHHCFGLLHEAKK
jgi:hypothetical protein